VAASVVRPDALFRELRGRPAEVHDLLDHITEFQLVFARQLADAGADVIVIHEDTATPALLGPAVFERIVVPYLHQLIIAVRETGVPVLLHVCGAINRVESALGRLHLDGFIPDAAVPLNHFARTFPHLAIVGNVSTFLLHQGHPQQIARIASQLADGSVHAIAPACGLSSATPLASIRALTAGDRPHE
jgi:[methyl-Co(III) methanol-specific corrinoid protein]:coenzyme M methyltransferase